MVPRAERPDRHPPTTREGLPIEFTPETVRHLGLRTLRRLAQPDNGVLDPEEQKQFDAAYAEVRRATASLVQESLRRARAVDPANLDPAMRRTYLRTQERLAAQAGRARDRFPELDLEASPDPGAPDASKAGEGGHDDDVSPGVLEQEVEQSSETLDMLERIASLQQQQLEHQESQLLSETRGLFFAFLVSVAVIIAGVAPLVEAEPHHRLVIVLWTVAVIAAAAVVYALVRVVQGRKSQPPGGSAEGPLSG